MSKLTETQQYTEIDELIEGKGIWKNATKKTLQDSIRTYNKRECYKIVHALYTLIEAKFTNKDNRTLNYDYQLGQIRQFKTKGGILLGRDKELLRNKRLFYLDKHLDLIALAFDSAASRQRERLATHEEGDEHAHTEAHFMLMRACLKSI